jgi:NAD(P)-dependent dehydrogenase (short-subunit alcohol dehydrogenase family)
MQPGSYDLAGRTVLITGAARGLGAGLARAMCRRGARVALVGLEPDRLDSLAAELGTSATAAAWTCDVSDREMVDRAVTAAAAHFGGLDVVVANAGVTAFGSLADLDPAAFERVIDINLLGVYRTLHAAVPHVVARRGYLLSVASMAAAIQSPLQGHYTASKAGVAALSNSLRIELRPTGTRVGVAYPTFSRTDMMAETLADPQGRQIWRGNRGVWSMISEQQAVDGLVRAIERRARHVVIPRRLTPVALAPGLFQPLLERSFTNRRLRAMSGPAVDDAIG